MVISIIALLMAILLPTFGRVRRQAKAVACQTSLHQSGLYFAAYAAEHDGKLDMRGGFASGNYFLYVVAGRSWERRKLLLCPMATRPKPTDESEPEALGDTFSAWKTRVWGGPTPRAVHAGSYGWNYRTGIPACGLGSLETKAGASIPVYLDCIRSLMGPDRPEEPPPYPGYEEVGVTAIGYSCINRHDGGVNCLFMDWSVRKVGLKELWTLKWHGSFDTAGPWTKAGGVRPEDWPEWMRKFKDY